MYRCWDRWQRGRQADQLTDNCLNIQEVYRCWDRWQRGRQADQLTDNCLNIQEVNRCWDRWQEEGRQTKWQKTASLNMQNKSLSRGVQVLRQVTKRKAGRPTDWQLFKHTRGVQVLRQVTKRKAGRPTDWQLFKHTRGEQVLRQVTRGRQADQMTENCQFKHAKQEPFKRCTGAETGDKEEGRQTNWLTTV